MKHNIFSMIAALLILLLPLQSRATATYGAFVTPAYYGSVRVFESNGTISCQDYWIDGIAFDAPWTVEFAGPDTLTVSVDAHLILHSVITTWTYFTGAQYRSEPSLTTIDVTVPVSGLSTMGVQVNDYYRPSTVLYTSGKGSGGSLLELPVSQGGFTIQR